jgi:diguanylate cyclase (GGDEF)-like protein
MRILVLDSAKSALSELGLGDSIPPSYQIFDEAQAVDEDGHINLVLSSDVSVGMEQAEHRDADGFVWLAVQPSVEQVIGAMRQGAVDVWTLGQKLSEDLPDLLKRLNDRCKNRMRLSAMDPISGTCSHTLLHETLDREIESANQKSRPLSMLLLDIDGFAAVNEESSYQTGDQMLWQLGQLLLSATKETKTQDLVARVSGDRFAMVLLDTDKRGAAVLANRLRKRVQSENFGESGSQTVSIGVAALSDGAKDRVSLLRMAGSALTGAKRRGRNRVMTYAPVLDEDVPQAAPSLAVEIELFNALEESIEQGLFRSVYQPIVNAKSITPFAFEALCRPAHQAFPGPYQLFQVAERAGRIAELGRATRGIAVEVADQLPEDTSLFLNLHPRELTRELEAELTSLFANIANKVVLEVTESAELPDTEFHKELIRRLKAFGFRVALDDLGAGYAGLNSLATLEPDIVKLDMELVRGIDKDRRSARLVRHIIDFADEENILVVAEGVETKEEAKAAISLGCHLLQGYFFAKPGPAFPSVSADALK